MKHAKTIIYIIVIIAIVGAGAYALYNRNTEKKYTAPTEEFVAKISKDPELDSDSDGLKDWEEVLWQTNPLLADTDSDGTNDGEEVANRRDPVLKGPADKTSAEEQANVTTKIAEELIDTFITNKGLEKGQSEKIASDIIKSSYSNAPITLYTKADLKLTTNTIQSYKAFGNGVASAFLGFDEGEQNELVIFGSALQNNSEATLSLLDPIILSYKSFLSELLLVPTPSELADKQIAFINATNKVISNVEGMKLLFSNTTVSMSALASYKNDISSFADTFSTVIEAIQKKGVTYSPSESGYGLLNVL